MIDGQSVRGPRLKQAVEALELDVMSLDLGM